MDETPEQRSQRILAQLKERYPGKAAFDLDGRGLHFVCEIEPGSEHPDYDRAIEVIIQSKPHKHLKTTQTYKVILGELTYYAGDKKSVLQIGEEITITPGVVHWAKSQEAWVEVYSTPAWTAEDHILVDE